MTYKLQIFLEMIKVAKSSKYNRNTLWHSLVAKIWNQTISHIKNTCKDNCSVVLLLMRLARNIYLVS